MGRRMHRIARSLRPHRWCMTTLSVAHLLVPALSAAQDADSTRVPQKTFFVQRDLVATGIAIAGTGVVSGFDRRVAHWARSAGVQGDSSRRELVGDLTRVNETPLMLAALATYGVGRVAGSHTTADVGLHT